MTERALMVYCLRELAEVVWKLATALEEDRSYSELEALVQELDGRLTALRHNELFRVQ